MTKLTKNNEIEKLKKVLMCKIKLENDSRYVNLSFDEIMKIVIDSSNKGKYVLWVLREYIKENIQRFEDMERVKQALTLFKNNLSKFTEQQKQLNKMSFQELETLVSSYQDVLTQNEIKRMNKEKIWEEIDIIYEGSEGRIYVPKTEQASIFLGQGTKWCTAAANNNMFGYYNEQGPLYIFVTNNKDENGREEKYQLHLKTAQFMDMQDQNIEIFHEKKLMNIWFNSFSQKEQIENLILSNMCCEYFLGKSEFSDIVQDIIFEKVKLGFSISENFWKKYLTLELCKKLINMSENCASNVFHDIPLEFKTLELCKLAVMIQGSNLGFVPEEVLTKEFCELVVAHDGSNLRFIPEDLITPELCEIAVKQNGIAISYVPYDMMTKELCEIAIQQNGNALEYVINEYRTKDLYEKACEIYVKNNFNIYHIPEIFRNKEMCEIAIERNPENLIYVPNDLKTPELCKKSIEKGSGSLLRYVPEKLKTYELCQLAITRFYKYSVFEYVPLDKQTPELCEMILKIHGLDLKFVKNEFKTFELCKIAIKQEGHAFHHVPNELKTKDFYELYVGLNGNVLYHVPKEFITYELCKSAVKSNGWAIRYVPDEFRTQELCEMAVEQNKNAFEIAGKYLKNSEICNDVLQYAIETKNERLLHAFLPDFWTKEKCEKIAIENPSILKFIESKFITQELYVIALENFLQKNNLNYSVEDAIKELFSGKNNSLKTILNKVFEYNDFFENIYIDIVLETLCQKLKKNSDENYFLPANK